MKKMNMNGWQKAGTVMLWLLVVAIICFIHQPIIQGATLQELDTKLRNRVNEVDTTTSLFDSTAAFIWLNLAQSNIAVIAGYFPKVVNILFTAGDSVIYELPLDYRSPRQVFIKANKRMYPVLPTSAETLQNGIISYSIVWHTEDSAKIVMSLGGFQSRQTDVIFSLDSTTYLLPDAFRNAVGVITFGVGWEKVVNSPMFTVDGKRLFDIQWKHRDSALLYLRGDFDDGDTVRVFYQETLEENDTIRVEYLSIPTDMVNGDANCEVPDDLEKFLIDEAMGYYFFFLRDKETAQLIWQQVRLDMGIIQPGGQQ